MWNRCTLPAVKAYPEYGGRGIKVCRRWAKFENFLADMGRRPSAKHTLERKNNSLGYRPSNCCWATMLNQNRNKRNVKLSPPKVRRIRRLLLTGLTQQKIGDMLGVSRRAVSHVNRGERWADVT